MKEREWERESKRGRERARVGERERESERGRERESESEKERERKERKEQARRPCPGWNSDECNFSFYDQVHPSFPSGAETFDHDDKLTNGKRPKKIQSYEDFFDQN